MFKKDILSVLIQLLEFFQRFRADIILQHINITMLQLQTPFQMERTTQQFPLSFKTSNLYKQDYNSLQEGQWLTSEIINISFLFLQDEFKLKNAKLLDPTFVNYLMFEDDEEELSKLAAMRLFEYQNVLIPINTNSDKQGRGDHWSLAVLQVKTWDIVVFDSTAKLVDNVPIMGEVLAHLYQILTKTDKDNPKPVLRKHVPKQNNSSDCGVYTIGFAKAVLRQLSQGKRIDQQIDWKQINFSGLRTAIKERIDSLMR